MINFIKALHIIKLRKSIFYTFCFLAIYRLGIFITIPGINHNATKNYLHTSNNNNVLNFFNFFSGGAIENASIFALGIMPYITASIIMSLMIMIIPTLKKMQQENDLSRKQITQYTRYSTVIISLLQSIMITKYFKTQYLYNKININHNILHLWNGFGFIVITMLTLTAGTVFIMWIGEKITEQGIGNGISLIIFASIISKLPNALYSSIIGIKNNIYTIPELLIISAMMLIILIGIIFIELAQRKIPIQYAKRIIKNKKYGGQTTHLPLKINTAGVMPPIFASTIIMFPTIITSIINIHWLNAIQIHLTPGKWLYQLLLIIMIFFFSYFYTNIQFNPIDVSDNIKKFGGFIPGIRPGKSTSNYIHFIINRLTFSGSLYLSIICTMPLIIHLITSNPMPFHFGGTGLLIVVSVALDSAQHIENNFINKQYDNIHKNNKIIIKARYKQNKDHQL